MLSKASFRLKFLPATRNGVGAHFTVESFDLVALAVTFSFFQHFASGLRHLVLDIGAGYELKTNRTWASVAFVAAFFATAFVALFVASRFIGVL